jgi:hypothetical protein
MIRKKVKAVIEIVKGDRTIDIRLTLDNGNSLNDFFQQLAQKAGEYLEDYDRLKSIYFYEVEGEE